MTITHDYIAQTLHEDRADRLAGEVRAARLAKPAIRRPRGHPGRRPWWHGLRLARSSA